MPKVTTGATLHLIRHADAGARDRFEGSDVERPLSKKGRRQAAAIAVRFGRCSVVRVLSSPATRCLQTVEPLANAFGLTVDVVPGLAEGADPKLAFSWLSALTESTDAGDVIASTHGDILEGVLVELAGRGVRIEWPMSVAKASTLVIGRRSVGLHVELVPPPVLKAKR